MDLQKDSQNISTKIYSYLSSIKLSPTSWIIGVSALLWGRFFLESISSHTSSGILASDSSTLVHYYLFYIAFAFAFMLFLHFAIPEYRKVIPALTAIAFASLFIAPLLDFVISRGDGFLMTYLFDTPKEMLYSLVTFFGPNLKSGITIGIRIEVGMILASIFVLVYLVSKNIKRALFSTIILYLIIFIFLSLPSFISLISLLFGSNIYFGEPMNFIQNTIKGSTTIANNLHSTLEYSSIVRLFEIAFNFFISKIIFLLLLILSTTWFYLNYKNVFVAIIKNSRIERVAHYFLMVALGIFFSFLIFYKGFSGYQFSLFTNLNDFLSLVMLLLSIYFSWMFAVGVNDIADTSIDEVTNTDRPLVQKLVTKNDMQQASLIFLLLSLFSGFLAGFTAFFLIVAFTTLYYIYSVPPTRFKTIPFFSSFLIALCCLSVVLSGFMLVAPVKSLTLVPTKLVVAVVVIYFLWAHIRDMKDIEGDRKEGITTVPVLFGDIWGPRVVAILSSLAFLVVPLFTKVYFLFLPSIITAYFNYRFILRKPYVEKYIFRTYFVFVLTSLSLIFIL